MKHPAEYRPPKFEVWMHFPLSHLRDFQVKGYNTASTCDSENSHAGDAFPI